MPDESHNLQMKQALTLRKATAKDVEWLPSLRKETMNPHLEASGIQPVESGHIDAIKTDFGWAKIVLLNGERVGMVKAVKASRTWQLRQIQISPEYQGNGIGTYILKNLIKEANIAACPIELNVLLVNPAKIIYEKLGFVMIEHFDRSQKMRLDA